MPQGTLVIFSDFEAAVHRQDVDPQGTLKMALVSDSQATFSKSTADPRWGAGGSTDLSTNEVSGTNYTAGGNACASATITETGDVIKYDADDPAGWVQDGAGPDDIKTGILYIDDANDYAVGFIDMTADDGATAVSLQAGNVSYAHNAGGIFTITN